MTILDDFLQQHHDETRYCEMLKDYRPEKCECGNREASAELSVLRAEIAKLVGLIDQHEMAVEQDTIATLRAELAALMKGVLADYCLWIPSGNFDDNVWASQCGNEFILEEGTPKGNGFVYCPYCGKVLKEEQT